MRIPKKKTQKNYKISFRNRDTKILNNILLSKIQQYIKRITQHDQMELIPRMQIWFKIQKPVNVINHI